MRTIRKLIVPQLKHLQQTTPVAPLGTLTLVPPHEATFPAPLATISLISSTTQSQLLAFLNIHLTFPLTLQTLLRFLKNKLHYHPKFTHLDFHVFQWASTVDSYRHDHHTYEWMIRTLAISESFDALRVVVLDIMPSKPCPCSDGIFAAQGLNQYLDLPSILIADRLRTAEADRLRLLASSKGLDADVVTYKILMGGCSREGKIKEGELLVAEMLDKDYISDITSSNRLIDGLHKNISD